jgi:hypothetical protein
MDNTVGDGVGPDQLHTENERLKKEVERLNELVEHFRNKMIEYGLAPPPKKQKKGTVK